MSVFIIDVFAISSQKKEISVFENEKAGYLIANVAKIFSISKNDKNFNFILLDEKIDALTPWSSFYPFGSKSHQIRKSTGAWLTLNSKNGHLKLAKDLDREELCRQSISCFINAKIYYGVEVFNLEIEVIDVNDNKPKFPVAKIDVNVSESTTTNDIISLDAYMAIDLDSGKNSEIRYSLTSCEEFSVDEFIDSSETQHLQLNVLKSLDYEKKTFYQLTLKATDGGSPSLFSEVILLINVLDVNDNSPIFDENNYSTMVYEHSKLNEVIFTVHATDADTGAAGHVRYSLAKENTASVRKHVQIDRLNGSIILKEQFDRESIKSMKVEIDAEDMGRRIRKGRTQLMIYVGDVNDNVPSLTIKFLVKSEKNQMYIEENSSLNLYLLYASVKDLDARLNGEVDLTLTTVKGTSDMFVLHDQQLVKLNGNLDRESVDNYELMLTACDRGKIKMCAEEYIKVTVLDVNEHIPEFSQKYVTTKVRENLTNGTLVTELTAYDKDSLNSPSLELDQNKEIRYSSNGVVTYFLKGGANNFWINPKTGFIYNQRCLDREETVEWKLTIIARDGGNPPRESNCNLTITILDENDNRPIFTNPSANNTLFYSTVAYEHIITKIKAADADEGINSNIVYKILLEDNTPYSIKARNYSSIFLIDKKSGDLQLNRSLTSLSDIVGRHHLVVEASDKGVPKQSSIVRLLVHVIKENVIPPHVIDQTHTAAFSPVITVTIVLVTALGLTILFIYVCIKCERKAAHEQETKIVTACNVTQPMIKAKSFEDINNMNRLNLQKLRVSGSEADITKVTICKQSCISINMKSLGSTWNSNSIVLPLSHVNKSSNFDSLPYFPCVTTDVKLDDCSNQINHQNSVEANIIENHSKKGAPKLNSDLGQYCSLQCLKYGHGDTCWMPLASTGKCECLNMHINNICQSLYLFIY